jgi:hypothetical protein
MKRFTKNTGVMALAMIALLVTPLPSQSAIWSPNITPPGQNIVGVNIVDSFLIRARMFLPSPRKVCHE